MLNFSDFIKFFCLSLFCISSSIAGSVAEPKYCPTFCECDVFVGLNRANCSSQRLISPNVELPPAAQILDLSYNDITTLDNNCFQSFAYLLNLTISHNSLHTIYLDAFSPLRRVRHIDLFHNRLEYVDERIFESNHHLESLNLAANKFMSLQNKPLLRSTTLRSLNLSNSQINYIYMDLFLALPNLRHLDVSQNLMITLNMAAFSSLQHLESVNLNANRWNCDRGLLRPIEQLHKRGIQVELMECAIQLRKDVGTTTNANKDKMFERLEMLGAKVQLEVTTLQAQEEEVQQAETRTNIENIWRHLTDNDDNNNNYDDYDDDDDDDNDNDNYEQNLKQDVAADGQRKKLRILYPPEVEQCDESWHKMCHKYRKCLTNMSVLLLDKVSVSESTARGSYTGNDLNFVFLMGISLGITFVVCIISCALCMKRCCEARRKQHYNNDYQSTYAPTAPVVTPVATPIAAPQIPPQRPQRISRRRAPNPNSSAATATTHSHANALIRRDYATPQGRDNFLSRLFGRPARHQYYRSINQNTATLIRRLSRSNLFSNRLSQHFNEESRQQGYVDAADLDNTNQTTNSVSGQAEEEERLYEEIFMGSNAVETPEPIIIRATNRPETPPPSYREVVVNVTK